MKPKDNHARSYDGREGIFAIVISVCSVAAAILLAATIRIIFFLP